MILHENISVNINEVGPQSDVWVVQAVKGTKVGMLGQMQQQCRHKTYLQHKPHQKCQIADMCFFYTEQRFTIINDDQVQQKEKVNDQILEKSLKGKYIEQKHISLTA